MVKKGYCCLMLVCLVSLSGCGKKKEGMKSRRERQRINMRSQEDIPLAQDSEFDIAQDDSVRSFFDPELEEFVALDDQEKEIVLAQNDFGVQDEELNISNDEFAWVEASVSDEQAYKEVYFGFNNDKPSKDQLQEIAANIEQTKSLLENSEDKSAQPTVVIEGHSCHSAGSAVYNLALSEKRAKIIADEFIAAGIPQENIKIIGRGQEVPAVVDGQTVSGSREEQWPNRRVETHIIYS